MFESLKDEIVVVHTPGDVVVGKLLGMEEGHLKVEGAAVMEVLPPPPGSNNSGGDNAPAQVRVHFLHGKGAVTYIKEYSLLGRAPDHVRAAYLQATTGLTIATRIPSKGRMQI